MTQTVPVPLHGIERALEDAWQDANTQSQTPVGRTLSTTLIAVAQRRDEGALDELLERVVQRHPCRAFVVLLDDAPEASLEASLATRLGRADTATIVHERVTLRCPTDDIGKVAGLVRPLIDEDIPSHLYWHGSPLARSKSIAELVELVDQVIFDSSTFADPVVDVGRQQSLPTRQACRVRDLTWFRLRPWRRALATALEYAPWSPELATTAMIRHSADERGLAASLILAEWLRERLRASTSMQRSDDTIRHCEPIEVCLAIGDASVVLTRNDHEHCLELHVTLADQCRLPSRMTASQGRSGDLLAAAMDDAR